MLTCYSIVVPVYNEAEVLPTFYQRLTQVMDDTGESYEIIFVNDGSQDASLPLLRDLHAKDARVKLVTFSRNFGHQVAITAGLDHSSGKMVVVMDADLQDPPEVIPRLIKKWQEGYDVVFAVREERKGDSLFKRLTASLFYRLLRYLTATEIPLDAGDFRLMSRKAIEALKAIRERNRFIERPGRLDWFPAGVGHLCSRRATCRRDEVPSPEDAEVCSQWSHIVFLCAPPTCHIFGLCSLYPQPSLPRICNYPQALY